MSLNNLANRLGALGRREAALAAAEEAVELRRALAAARPDAFTPDLAGSLNNLANRLSALGRREAALTAAEEAVELYRALAAARPDTFTPDLSMSLGMFTDIKIAAGDKSGALETMTEAIRILAPVFHQIPQAVARWMGMHLQRYVQLSEELGKEPDMELIGPLVEMIQRLQEGEDE